MTRRFCWGSYSLLPGPQSDSGVRPCAVKTYSTFVYSVPLNIDCLEMSITGFHGIKSTGDASINCIKNNPLDLPCALASNRMAHSPSSGSRQTEKLVNVHPQLLVYEACLWVYQACLTLDRAQSPRCQRLLFLGAHISEFQLIGLGEAVNFMMEEQSL